MKKISSKNKICVVIAILYLMSLNKDSHTAFAQMVVSDPALLSKGIFKDIKDTAAQVKNYLQYATQAYNTGKTVVNTAKNLQNFDLANVAKNLTGDNIVNLGSAILTNVGSVKMSGTNSFTNGSQVVTNLGDYLDKTSINEIRKTISSLNDPVNTTPYTAEIQKSIAALVRNTADKASGKLLNFTLPYVAQQEICNSEKLKDIIKNGEPETYIKAKPRVENVDIDKLCNANLNDSKDGARSQASFIGLAKSGYAGQKTRVALADPENTASGVVSSALNELGNAETKAVENASKQVESTGLVIGNQTCLGKDGKPVKFDPLRPSTAFCYSQNSSATNSAAITKEKVSAAAQSPYQALLAKADATKGDVGAVTGSASNIANILSSVIGLGIGESDFDAIASGADNPFAQLASSLSNIKETEQSQNDLYASAAEADKEYDLGTDGEDYSISAIQEKIDLYDQLRELNVTRLNHYSYTYVLMELAVRSSVGASVNGSEHSAWFFLDYKNLASNMESLTKSKTQMKQSLANLTKEMKTLIKEMAKNNYKEQELEKLLSELRKSNLSENEIRNQIKSALQDTVTTEQYSEAQIDWNYVPEYQQDLNDPTTDNSGKVLVLNPDEITGPFTLSNLFNIRIRAYKTLWLFNINRFDENLLKGFGIQPDGTITPNMPRTSQAPNLLNTKDSKKYSEISFCNKLGINICTN